jgi:hypothetical protein
MRLDPKKWQMDAMKNRSCPWVVPSHLLPMYSSCVFNWNSEVSKQGHGVVPYQMKFDCLETQGSFKVASAIHLFRGCLNESI